MSESNEVRQVMREEIARSGSIRRQAGIWRAVPTVDWASAEPEVGERLDNGRTTTGKFARKKRTA